MKMTKNTVVVAKTDDGSVTLTFTLPWSEVLVEKKKALFKISANVTVPGFRKGKAPEDVVENNEYIFGYTGSFRMGDLLQFKCQAPEKKIAFLSLRAHLVQSWIPVLRKCLKEEGYMFVDKNVEQAGTFLVGYKGVLCIVYDDLQVGTLTDNYAAVGSGANYALGAMFATKHGEFPPEERLTLAIDAAAWHNAYVRAPFTIVKS